MRTIAFDGGPSLIEIGPQTEVQLFFDCVGAVAEPAMDDDLSVITDRLYRRYLRLEDLIVARRLMQKIAGVFKATLDSHRLSTTALGADGGSLFEKFGDYFEKFEACCESALIFYRTWGIYQPVRLVIADMPQYMDDKDRQLEEYESLVGSPFWQRET